MSYKQKTSRDDVLQYIAEHAKTSPGTLAKHFGEENYNIEYHLKSLPKVLPNDPYHRRLE